MMVRLHTSFLIAIAIVGSGGFAAAQTIDIGKAEFQSSCGPCHGIDAKGDGPVSKDLKTHPADLTLLAKKNGGVFPLNSLYNVIDGREAVSGHGSREMPVWGYRFVPKPKASDDYILSPAVSPELIVQARILAIVDYLSRIQAK
jgi:mono/diheme cytochrome c family protein